jgi:hypothetical protein
MASAAMIAEAPLKAPGHGRGGVSRRQFLALATASSSSTTRSTLW